MGALVLRRVHVDAARLNGAAQAKIYASYPSRLFVTNRGATLSAAAVPYAGNASLTVLDNLSGMPSVVESWPSPFALEGQDLSVWSDRALVVVDLARGLLLVFNASRVSAGPVSSLNLTANVALHVRLFHHPTTRARFALITSGEATGPGRLLFCDVTDPYHPRELGSVALNVTIPEGVLVHDQTSTAYVGGCTDTKLVTIDLSPLPGAAPVIRVAVEDGPLYSQMVSTPNPLPHEAWFALYGGYGTSPVGGIARFSIDAASGDLRAVERLLDARLIGANRVALAHYEYRQKAGYPGAGRRPGSITTAVALLPLEHSPVGGLAVVRLSPAPLAIESLVHFEHTGPNANVTTTRCFCAVGTQSTNGDGGGSSLVHAFVGSSSSMFTFELRGPSFAGGSVEGAPRDNAEEGRVKQRR